VIRDLYNSKGKIFLIGCLVFILGIALASFMPNEYLRFNLYWFSAGIFFLILTFLFWQKKEDTPALLPINFLLFGILLLAIWRYSLSLPAKTPDKIWYYNNRALTVLGYIANEPDIRDDSQKLEISSASLSLNGLWQTVNGIILVTTDLYPEYEYGERVEIVCELKQPEEFKGFAYDRYLARYNIYSICYYPKISLVAGTGGNYFYTKIFNFKNILTSLIDRGMGEPESSLARPIVFGGQKGLEEAIRNNFQKTGLTHIMAVSGFNISILSVIVMAVLLVLGVNRKHAFYLAVAILAAYIVLVGLPASAMRAGLMGFLVLWALRLGRLNKMTNSLILTAAILLIINPKLLRDDIGFQLSFLAVAGLVYVYPIFEALWEKLGLPRLKGISDALLITLAAQVFTLPVLAFNFSQISLIAPLANLAVLWTLPILTVLILIALPLSLILPGLAFIFFLPSLILTKYILVVVKYLAKIPYGYMEVGYFWPGWMLIYYILTVLILIKLKRSELLNKAKNDKIET
jgi:competence protein ComEC